MHVQSHGVDIVEVARISRMIQEHGERFLERCFTQGELGYCTAAKRRDEHLAARFAAKEAVLKALGTGWRSGIAWTDVEVVRDPAGAPGVRLHGEAARIAAGMGISAWSLSMSHSGQFAVASALGLTLAG
jgi:holo-[acyl-carrier protein] synthase